jgi:transketolase C-terminal domain/subunit
MERGNISAAAGFGMQAGRQGVFSTFAAFLEMCLSELTMARLNRSNLLCHFSHSGIDDIADNTCHFGLNIFFADNGLEEEKNTRLYFPVDSAQLKSCVEKVFNDPGIRFVFSTRSKVPALLDVNGKPLHDADYKFTSDDELVRDGPDGALVSFGDAVYRCVDAAERLKKEGISLTVVNKSTLNVVDEAMLNRIGKLPFVLVVEPISVKTGLGIRFGTWLLERGLTPKYRHMGAHRDGSGGLWEQAYHQGYNSEAIIDKVKDITQKRSKL